MATTILLRDLIVAKAILLGTIVVGVAIVAAFHASLNKRVDHLMALRHVGYVERT